MSAEQRAKLAATQKAYVANDPRWPAHRQKLVAANVANRITLFPNEIAAAVTMRKRGRTFSYIAEEIGIDRDVLRRELRANGIPTGPLKADRRARRGKGPWRSFDDPSCMQFCLPTPQAS
jgi:DNA-binding phage protein